MTRRAGLTCVAGLLLASSLLAEPSIVRTLDGSSYRGNVILRDKNVIVTIRGVETIIPRSDVLVIEPTGDYEQDFQTRLAKLDSKDTAGRITLAREAFEQRRYDLARDTLENALSLDPNSRQAAELLDLVQSQIRLERLRKDVPVNPVAPRPALSGQQAIERRLLTLADIQAIRREELVATDTSVRIRFVGDVKKRYADSQNMTLADFMAYTPVEQALEIFARGDASMRDKVQILSDPQSIIEYRRQVQPLVLQNCATTGCHGGPGGGGLVLLTAVESDSATYTNFYILQSFSRRIEGVGTVFGGTDRRLIERGHGERSLLANYGLPANIAEYDHPEVNGKPIAQLFRNRLDARYLMLVSWMDDSLKTTEPTYGIRFAPPSAAARATTRPAGNTP